MPEENQEERSGRVLEHVSHVQNKILTRVNDNSSTTQKRVNSTQHRDPHPHHDQPFSSDFKINNSEIQPDRKKLKHVTEFSHGIEISTKERKNDNPVKPTVKLLSQNNEQKDKESDTKLLQSFIVPPPQTEAIHDKVRVCHRIFQKVLKPKKNILKSASFDVMQTVFFAFTCKFGLVL